MPKKALAASPGEGSGRASTGLPLWLDRACAHPPSRANAPADPNRSNGWHRLAVALAGVQDLEERWSVTTELAMQLFDRHQHLANGELRDVADREVLADVEDTLRRSRHQPLLIVDHPVADPDMLLGMIGRAEARYDELIAAHLVAAERVLTTYRWLLETGKDPRRIHAAILRHMATP